MAHRYNVAELGGGNKPPLCNKDKFANWKIRMQAYMDAIDEDLFETILNGPYIPTKLAPTADDPNRTAVKLRTEWTDTEKKAVQLDKKAKNILFMSLEDELFENVVNCKTAKEIWEALLIMHEGTEEVRENKQSLLTQQYEMFTYITGESITSTYERFNILLNSLRSFGKIHPNKELIIKFMRSLPTKWDAKTTAIRESKNLHSMTLQQLYGNLLTYELELNQRAESTSEAKRKDKGVALKTTQAISKVLAEKEPEEESEEEDYDESIAMLVKNLKKFMNKNRRIRPRRPENKGSSEDLCYNCKKPGHFIAQCNKPLREELRRDKKKPVKGYHSKKFHKKDRGLVAERSWSDSENDSSHDSSDDEEQQTANLCLMAREVNKNKELSIEEVFDFNSPDVNMEDLRTALHAVTSDLHKYMKWFKVLSKDYSLAQTEKEKMKEELETALQNKSSLSELEKENKELKQTISDNTQKESTLVSKIQDLEKTISVWNQSSASMDALLASQRSTTDGSGLGYSTTNVDKPSTSSNKSTAKSIMFVKSTNPNEYQIPKTNRNHFGLGYKKKEKQKTFHKNHNHKFSGVYNKQCYSCHKYGHIAVNCLFDYYVKPKIKQIWVPKGTNIKGPNLMWVPK